MADMAFESTLPPPEYLTFAITGRINDVFRHAHPIALSAATRSGPTSFTKETFAFDTASP
jgi:hypothetical protein